MDFKVYPLGPEEPILLARAPADPEGFDPIAAGPSGMCHGCWFYEEQYSKGLPCDCRLGKRFSCVGPARPDGRKVVFVPRLSYGNEEE